MSDSVVVYTVPFGDRVSVRLSTDINRAQELALVPASNEIDELVAAISDQLNAVFSEAFDRGTEVGKEAKEEELQEANEKIEQLQAKLEEIKRKMGEVLALV